MSDAGISNTAEMFSWLATRIGEAGQSTPRRTRSLKRSFFHFCVRQPLVTGRHGLASNLIAKALAEELIASGDARRMSAYAASFRLAPVSNRLAAWAGGVSESLLLSEYFDSAPSTFASIPVS